MPSDAGVNKDYVTALAWFKKSAEQGIGQAQFNLGVFYENGYGVVKDIEVARSWYKKAAAQGTIEADKKLAELNSPDYVAEPVVVETGPATDNTGAAAVATAPVTVDASENSTDVASEYEISTIAIDGIKREEWVMIQSPEHYTLQIGSVTREDAIVNFLKENAITNEAAYIQVVIKEVTRYNALYGVYDNYSEATSAVEDRPKGLRRVKP